MNNIFLCTVRFDRSVTKVVGKKSTEEIECIFRIFIGILTLSLSKKSFIVVIKFLLIRVFLLERVLTLVFKIVMKNP